jgi:nucleoside-diphosphate-sugar epimerase
MTRVLVTGAGGFIGGHLVARLREDGVGDVRAVDRVPRDQWYQCFDDVDSRVADLQGPRRLPGCLRRRRRRLQPGGGHGGHGVY